MILGQKSWFQKFRLSRRALNALMVLDDTYHILCRTLEPSRQGGSRFRRANGGGEGDPPPPLGRGCSDGPFSERSAPILKSSGFLKSRPLDLGYQIFFWGDRTRSLWDTASIPRRYRCFGICWFFYCMTVVMVSRVVIGCSNHQYRWFPDFSPTQNVRITSRSRLLKPLRNKFLLRGGLRSRDLEVIGTFRIGRKSGNHPYSRSEQPVILYDTVTTAI